MARALVIGGAGFIGSSLVERLIAEQWHVEVVDDLSSGSIERLGVARADAAHTLRIHRHDVTDPTTADLVERAVPDRIYFLADVPPAADPARSVEIGAVALVRVLEGARRIEVPPKVIMALAAADLHGPGTAEEPLVTEADELRPVDARGAAAVSALAILRAYRAGASIEHTVLVLGEVYGPGMPARGDLGGAVARPGGRALPDRRFDLVHLDDTVDALVRAATRADGLVVHVGSGDPVCAADLAAALDARGIRVRVEGQPSAIDAPALDVGRAAIHLGWTPFTPLDVGLASLGDEQANIM